MPKAKTVKNVRITKAIPFRRKRLKEEGRPRGTLKKYNFEETKLGFMLLYEAPVVYNILLNNLPNTPFPEPSIELVEVICKASKDPSLNKPKFKRYLHEYAQTGLYCRRPKRLTPNRQSYYSRIRKNKLDRYIKINQQRLDILKKGLVP
ncbi:hypothetical protein [Parabacteroides goldsteinii]|jgi:hypothetical protein|uniref:hypothetical protein n=1 Tax=Parabacteroides goldsteinii TaxID=328812 RepID=UPI001D38EDAC|nr:hypothetical protein [Parabacteroides goldsteinii]MBS6574763.1 hypothetical protein [Parabacteroides goldsteinii]DAU78388.1 MAG TPA: hypothetical protein [Caudoviricetes sp.]